MKKPRLTAGKSSTKSNSKGKGKEHAYERNIIPIPRVDESDSDVLSEEELEFLAENIEAAGGFLKNLDEKGIARCVFSIFIACVYL